MRNIKVHKESGIPWSHKTGGAFARTNLEIWVDSNLCPKEQTELVIHEVLESWLSFLSHDKIDNLTDDVVEALEQLKEE